MMYPQNIGNDYILVNTPTFLIPQNFGNWKTTLFLSGDFIILNQVIYLNEVL